MATPASGEIFFVDNYGTIYETYWETIYSDFGDLLDTTSITKQPYVWGEEDQGYISERKVFRRGICTTTRTVLQVVEGGYLVLAEGSSQEICTFQTTFPCQPQPSDPFRYHLDHDVCDSEEIIVSCGPRWADPDEENDDEVVWADVTAGGDVSYDLSTQPIEWLDVWSNSEDLTANCDI